MHYEPINCLNFDKINCFMAINHIEVNQEKENPGSIYTRRRVNLRFCFLCPFRPRAVGAASQ